VDERVEEVREDVRGDRGRRQLGVQGELYLSGSEATLDKSREVSAGLVSVGSLANVFALFSVKLPTFFRFRL
jgi:hypothetical protein